MPEQPDRQKHRNRKYSVPYMGDGGKINCFSRSDFLQGRSQVRFGHNQSLNALGGEIPAPGTESAPPNPETYPKDWPKAGRVLGVPKVVVLSSMPCWPEFWSACQFIFPNDVIGSLLTVPGLFLNYYYFSQWDLGKDWTGAAAVPGGNPFFDGTFDGGEYRYNRVIATVQGAYQQQHSMLINKVFPAVQKALLNLPEPIYSIIPQWMPSEYDSINNGHQFTRWKNDFRYWDNITKSDECHPNVLKGIGQCDMYGNNDNMGYVHMDPNGPNNHSDTQPPRMPCLLSADPSYFGTDLLHLYVGHWAINWFGDGCLDYENWPQSPIALQIGPILLFDTYHGSAIPFFDGLRAIWRDYGPNFGYMNQDGFGGVKSLLGHYHDIIATEAENYKKNFWKFRNVGTRIFQYPNSMQFNWQAGAIAADQKWCAAAQFYFGQTFSDFSNAHKGEDIYAKDWSSKYNGLRFANVITRIPTSPDIRTAIYYTAGKMIERISGMNGYYTTIEPGTSDFMQGMIDQHGLADYNVVNEGQKPSADVLNVDSLVEYIVKYYKSQDLPADRAEE